MILVIHGPNLNLLGEREPQIYGTLTLSKIDEMIDTKAERLKLQVKHFQSNHEGDIIDFIHENRHDAKGILINPAALTHYSYALRDAISAVALPCVEVHLSDIQEREPFRKRSVLKEICLDQISGEGVNSYLKGLELLAGHLGDAD
ncbi:type II 3-dehydroquinate dehydratase [candidate division KSB1 bacterium]|nr:type II 3-dehydroquinate dehydratase [candidate division KSB1 bacterium]